MHVSMSSCVRACCAVLCCTVSVRAVLGALHCGTQYTMVCVLTCYDVLWGAVACRAAPWRAVLCMLHATCRACCVLFCACCVLVPSCMLCSYARARAMLHAVLECTCTCHASCGYVYDVAHNEAACMPCLCTNYNACMPWCKLNRICAK
jgi:hypothetical protein